MKAEYIPYETLAANGPREITATMYPTIQVMLGELTTLAYNPIRPVIGKFEIPVLEKSPLSSVASHADRFMQCAHDLAKAILFHEQPELLKDMPERELNELIKRQMSEVPTYVEKAYRYLLSLNRCPEFDWPMSMTFAKMTAILSDKKKAFK